MTEERLRALEAAAIIYESTLSNPSVRPDLQDAYEGRYWRAANPAAVLELIAEIRRLKGG